MGAPVPSPPPELQPTGDPRIDVEPQNLFGDPPGKRRRPWTPIEPQGLPWRQYGKLALELALLGGLLYGAASLLLNLS